MAVNDERRAMIRRTLYRHGLDGLVCALPENVLMISGYWPMVGKSIAMASADGRIELIVPDDERELATGGWADSIHTFPAGSLDAIVPTLDAIRPRFDEAAVSLGLRGARIGFEGNEGSAAAGYPEVHMFGSGMASLLNSTFLLARPADAARALQYLRAIKTPYEVDRIRAACMLAATAYRDGARMLRAGMTEIEAVVPFRIPLFDGTTAGATRRDGFVFCMSGPNGAEAYRSYQRSRDRRLDSGDFVLVHCNSYLDGYWTDITRTFLLGPADGRSRDLLDAIAEARRAAIDAVRPGARAADVDRAAREVLSGRGFAEEFKHPAGHGVGFLAIDHNAWPCLHPASNDVLESGMVFNIEPGIYIDGSAGLRHCDMVAVTADGCELLTPFLPDPADLILE